MLCLNLIAFPSAQEAGRRLLDIGLGALPLILLAAVVQLWVLYILSLQRALRSCSPESRKISPEAAWLLLIPVVRTFWHFRMVDGLGASLGGEFKRRNLPDAPSKPGWGVGLAMCALPILSAGLIGTTFHMASNPAKLVLVGYLARISLFLVLAGVFVWVAYWVKIAGYCKQLAKTPPDQEAELPDAKPPVRRGFLLAGIVGLSLFLAASLPPAVGFLLFVTSGRAAEAADAYAVVYPHWYSRYLFNGEYVSHQEVRKITLMQVRSRYPQYADNPMILHYFEQQAGAQLVEQKVLGIESERRGLSATDGEVNNFLHQGQFGAYIYPNGQYIGDERFAAFIKQQFGFSVTEFKHILKLDLAIKKLQDKVTAGVNVSDEDVRESYRKANVRIKFDYAVIDSSDLLKTIAPSESELESFYQHNAARYSASIPEQARSRHILILVAPGADAKADAQARAKAEGILKQIQRGADFADLARKFSEDPGSKDKGGELGFAQRGSMVPEFEKALFGQKIGEAQIVKSQFGYHIVQVEERNAAHAPSFADVKPQVAEDFRREQLAVLIQKKTADLAAKAKAENNLAKAAKEMGVSFHSSDLVGAGDQAPLFGQIGKVAPQLFDLKPGEFSGPINAGRTGVVAELVDKQLPSDEEIAKNFNAARDGLREQRRSQVFNNYLNTLMIEYKRKGRISISGEGSPENPNAE